MIVTPLISTLKITISSHVLFTNKILAANKVDDIIGKDQLIEKFVKLKTKKLSKSLNYLS